MDLFQKKYMQQIPPSLRAADVVKPFQKKARATGVVINPNTNDTDIQRPLKWTKRV